MSAPANGAADWDPLLRRCLSDQREELLDAFRVIAETFAPGAIPTAPASSVMDDWRNACFEHLMAVEDDVPAFRAGSMSFTYRIINPNRTLDQLADLRDIVERIKGRETGWPLWLLIRDDLHVDATERVIWSLLEGESFGPTDAQRGDLWLARADGAMFHARALSDDGDVNDAPLTFAVNLPVWRVW